MQKIRVFLVTFFVTTAAGAYDEMQLLPIKINLNDKPALQRGARLFMNYCSGCHSLRYLRYSRMANDLGLITFDKQIDENLLRNNLIFTSAKIHDPIRISMPDTDARQWFGKMPPDLSLTARARGSDWIYTYLKSFYLDEKKIFRTNNLLLPDVAMPNILAPLQGEVILVKQNTEKPPHLLLLNQGEMNQQQFDSSLQDLVTFLTYVAEPSKLVRYRMGIFVVGFLCILFIVAYQLKKVYWRNIH